MTDLESAQAVLDAHSRAIQAVVAAAAPAVLRVEAARGGRGRDWPPGRARTNFGSGFVIDAGAGLAVTNFHVVRDSRHVIVHRHDGTSVRGEVAGADADADLAVIRVKADDLAALQWGDSAALRVGSVVLALGNPDGDCVVATSGIVSALGRRLRGPAGRLLEDLIQTDTIFNPGMSGGPLVNTAGQVVGINTASLVEAQGINLAISSASARTLASDLARFGEIRRPLLGIAGERQRLYGGLVRHHNLAQTHGVYVHEVRAGHPAANAGIRAGDILIGVDGQAVEGLDDLHRILSGKEFGAVMAVRLLRDLELVEVTVTLDAPAADTSAEA